MEGLVLEEDVGKVIGSGFADCVMALVVRGVGRRCGEGRAEDVEDDRVVEHVEDEHGWV